jgi:hypothetical protein
MRSAPNPHRQTCARDFLLTADTDPERVVA